MAWWALSDCSQMTKKEENGNHFASIVPQIPKLHLKDQKLNTNNPPRPSTKPKPTPNTR